MSVASPELSILFRIISRHSLNRLQGWHRACPGSRIEHLKHGLYVLHIPAGVMRDSEGAK